QPSNLNVSRSQTPVPSSLSPIVHVREKETTHLSIEDLANWLVNPEIKNNPKEDSKDLDKKMPWPVSFPNNEEHRKVWQKGIQTAKDMFKVDGAEYTFLIWFATIEEDKIYEAEMTKEHAKKILNTIDND
ncbi:19554_t:CDS:2, partial [Racocetra persica]